MTTIRITLSRDDFRALVSGKEISILEQVAIKTRRFGFGPSSDNDVHLILEDIGWRDMEAIIEEAWHGSDSSDAPERKPFHKVDFDECECGDYRQDHDPETGRCRMPDNIAHGMEPCLGFKLTRAALEIPEPFRSR